MSNNFYKDFPVSAFSVDKSHLSRRTATLELIGDVSGKKILDVGCAWAFVSGELAKRNEVHGIDKSQKLLVLAAERGLKTIKGDIQEGLPFPPNSFDFVLAAEVLEHVFDTDALIFEFSRVLKEWGTLIMSVPNCCSLNSRVCVVLGRMPCYIEHHCRPGMAGHIRGYNLPVIRKQLKEHGFKIEKIRTNGIYFWRLFVPWRWRFLRSFGENIIVKARVIK
ncbi:Ubiquinone biosynthesis O-methyltransferase [subsurface metagenome]